MLTSEGGIKVLDFGIAKVVAETTTRLTATGMTVGTPAYLSPEQLTGRPVDGRSDQYSTGCLLYELLTGRPPFLGDSPFAVMHQHISQEPVAPSRLRPQIPAVVDDLVLRTLAKDREQRLGSAAELRDALAATLTALGSPAAAPKPRTAAPAPGAPPAPAVPPARTKADTKAGPGHTAPAQQETRTALTPPRPAVPPPGGPVDPVVAGAADGGSRTPYTAPPSGGGRSSSPGERRFTITTGRIVALLGIVVSGVVTIGYQDAYADASDELVGVWVAAVVLGLALFRWLPVTSTLLWWGAGALVMASVAVGGGVDDHDYTSVTESDFSTLYYYDTSYGAYHELPADSSGYRPFEDDYSGGYDPAQADVSQDYTAHDNIEILAMPALALAALCLVRALSRRRPSPLAAAAGLTLGGLGVGWLALGSDEQTGMFSLGWGVIVIVAVVQEIRARRSAPPRVRRRLRFVTAE